MAQKRLSDFFSNVSKQTRNEKEDNTVTVETSDGLHEWLELKMHVLRRQERISARPFWKAMFTGYSDRFPNLLMLAEISLVLPVQTACCERGNSCLARIIMDWRASLNFDTLEALMNIQWMVVGSRSMMLHELCNDGWPQARDWNDQSSWTDWSLHSSVQNNQSSWIDS